VVSNSFLFEALRLPDDGPGEPPDPESLAAAAVAVGWLLGDRSTDQWWTTIRVRNGDVSARISISVDESGWSLSLPDDLMRWADGRPNADVQESVLDLVRALLEAAPPYVGVSCWPFGPSTPEVYEESTPFALRQVGSVLYLGGRYLETHGADLELSAAPVQSQQALAGGVLLVADRDLLHSADDGDLDDLRTFFGLPAVGRR
jgi:hypothetical protein